MPSAFRMGVKVIFEQSTNEDVTLNNHNSVGSIGFQILKRINTTKSGIETGIYYYMKYGTYNLLTLNSDQPIEPFGFYFHNISIPVNLRFEIHPIYISGGAYIDYLIKRTDDRMGYIYNISDRKFNVGTNLNFGFEKSIANSRSNFFLECRFMRNVTNALQKGRDGYIFVNYGLAAGINFKL